MILSLGDAQFEGLDRSVMYIPAFPQCNGNLHFGTAIRGLAELMRRRVCDQREAWIEFNAFAPTPVEKERIRRGLANGVLPKRQYSQFQPGSAANHRAFTLKQ